MKRLLSNRMGVMGIMGLMLPAFGQSTNPPGIRPLTGVPGATQFPVIVDANGAIVSPTNFYNANFPQVANAVTQFLGIVVTQQNAGTVTLQGGLIGNGGVLGVASNPSANGIAAIGNSSTSKTNVSAYFVGDGSGITNVGSQFGNPQNVGLDRLYKFYKAVSLGTRPVRVLGITDLGNFPGGTSFSYSMRGLFGNIGGFGGGGGDGDVALNLANVSQTIDATTWGVGSGLYYVTNGATATWSRTSQGFSGPGIRETNVYSTKALVWYLAETNGGTFKVQTNLNGGGWQDMVSIPCAAFGTNGAVTNLTLSPAGYYSIRVLGVSGTSRIIDGALWNDGKNGYIGEGSSFTITSRSVSDFNACPTNVTWPILKSAAPDLILVMDTAGPSSPPVWDAFNQMVTNCCPGADVVICGNHFVGVTDPTNAIAFNAEAITNCLKHGWGFFDTLNYLGVNVTDQTNSGIMNVDFVHPTVAGDDYLNGKLYAALMGKMAIQSHDHTDPIFQGGEVNLFNSSRTDPLGIGTAFPDKDARLTIQTDAQTEIKFAGGNQSAVITMQGNYLLGGPVGGTNITFQVDGNGDLWVTPGWPSGAGNMGNVIFGQPFPGTGLGTWYPSGGLRLGPATGISDPGAYVLAANALTVLNTTNQVLFGATNTAPSGVSTPTKWVSVRVSGETTVYRLPLYQ